MSEVDESNGIKVEATEEATKNLKRKKVLVLSRHVPKIGQLAEIRRMNNDDCLITLDNQRYHGIDDVVKRFEDGNYDDLAIVGSDYLIADLILSDIRPIRLLSHKIDPAEKTPIDYLNNDGTCYRYIAERAIGIKIFYERNLTDNKDLKLDEFEFECEETKEENIES